MSKKIGIYFNDRGFSEIDFTKMQDGNPGVGGTHYEFALLFYYLSEIYNITVFHHQNNIIPNKCKEVFVDSFDEAVEKSKDLDFIIFQANISGAVSIIEKHNVKGITWAHNFLSFRALNEYAKSKHIKKIVCVGKQLFWITRIRTNKAVLIYNMVSPVLFSPKSQRNSVVTYIGSLVPAKGFHVLAEIWPEIVKHFPDAQLFVIGSGSLYNRNAKMGKYGIAQNDYEELIICNLSRGVGKLPDNVHFLGNLGEEKKEIIAKTSIGVVNPTGRTETFGISALDFNYGGVVAIGNMPSIRNGNNGFRIHSKRGLKNKIFFCLNNKDYLKKMEDNCHNWVKNRYFPEVIIKEWKNLIESL